MLQHTDAHHGLTVWQTTWDTSPAVCVSLEQNLRPVSLGLHSKRLQAVDNRNCFVGTSRSRPLLQLNNTVERDV